jgi:hypothetical protein
MAANNKQIDTNYTSARKLMEAINNGRNFIEKLSECKAEMDAMTDGADVSGIAKQYGILNQDGTPNTAMANDLWYLVGSARDAFNGQNALTQLISWITPKI